jgi:exopolyphosphatase / guanosine-5'-triphosphate,3'-diphosphate pyrophosphatase
VAPTDRTAAIVARSHNIDTSQPGSPAARVSNGKGHMDFGQRPAHGHYRSSHGPGDGATYAALDLGTNNCRLLVAKPETRDSDRGAFRIVDSFSRIVRLGEGLSHTGRLGEAAIERTLGALEVCRDKMNARCVTRARLIATEACRAAQNGSEFLEKVRDATGLALEIVDRETEAHLAAAGCAALADQAAESVVLFDIGGGSSEIVWLARGAPRTSPRSIDVLPHDRVRFWVSLKLGVVTLAEKYGGTKVSDAVFEAMVEHVSEQLAPFVAQAKSEHRCGRFHLLGTSGTVTTIAGVYLGLVRYDRRKVDGLWMISEDVDQAITQLRHMSYEQRAANGCIGPERADLVLAGCAILEAIRRAFPAERLRIADRGLREGILMQLMSADHVWSQREA